MIKVKERPAMSNEALRVLLVEDDVSINDLLFYSLSQEGYAVERCYSGTEALRCMDQRFDIILLDLMLPGLSGEDFYLKIREKKIPTLVLSGRVDMEDKLRLLGLGVDDYITKPFEKREVLARMKIALRHHGKASLRFAHGPLHMDLDAHSVHYDGSAIELTTTEFLLLKTLLENPTRVFSKAQLYDAIWGEDYLGDTNAIQVHISNVRKKLTLAAGTDLLVTVWGIGYKLAPL